MALPLKKGDRGKEVRQLQRLLVEKGFPVKVDGDFGPETYRAVRAFQSQNLDQHGQPLVVDGKVGPLTWWSLNNPKPVILTPSAIDYAAMPPAELGGSRRGRAALEIAIGEMKAGACEIGGDNCGPWVRKYLGPAEASEGSSWCASFVSWCFLQASGGDKSSMPFEYTAGARKLLTQFTDKRWSHKPNTGYQPRPGDVVFWWRESEQDWRGHVGFVHQLKDGMLYTIEGNKSPKVQGFSYVFSRMEKLLGFGRVPQA